MNNFANYRTQIGLIKQIITDFIPFNLFHPFYPCAIVFVFSLHLQAKTWEITPTQNLKKTIEQAATTAGATTALWDAETDILSITYDTTKLTKEAVQKAIAQSGYDNAGYKATDEAYNNLHGCCKYDRTGAAGGTKSCEGGK